MVCALPLYHIFGFTVNMMFGLRVGARNILIPNPRDIKATLKGLAGQKEVPQLSGGQHAVQRHGPTPDFDKVDWSGLRISVGGGMAVQQATARLWKERRAAPFAEGYGSERDLALRDLPATRSMAWGDGQHWLACLQPMC